MALTIQNIVLLFSFVSQINNSLCLACKSLQRAEINKRYLRLYSKNCLHVMGYPVVKLLKLRVILYHFVAYRV